MALRRPRIKPTALLVTKRKPRDIKTENNSKAIQDDAEVSALSNVVETSDDNEKNIAVRHVERLETTKAAEEDNNSQQANSTVEAVIQDDVTTTLSKSDTNISTLKQCITTPSANEALIDTAGDNKLRETEDSFKCPATIEYTRNNTNQNNSNVGVDDVFYTDMEEITFKTDMHKNKDDKPATPSKHEQQQQVQQRIRPVPSPQRRNSLIGVTNTSQAQTEENTASSIDLATKELQTENTFESATPELLIPIQKPLKPHTQRRERHYSASMLQSPQTSNSGTGQHHYTPHKFTPTMGLGRIRTESNCSAFSESYVTATKMRKIDEQNHRTNHRKDFADRFVNGNIDKSSLKMFDLIYYNPTTNPMEKRTTISTIKKEAMVEEKDTKPIPTDTKEDIIDQKSSLTAMPVPQLKLNANGDLILDEKTLEIETTAEQEARKVLAKSSLIFLDENTGMNGFYRRQKRTRDWYPEETVKFYRCLQTVGTDFSLMCQLFPKRTRRDLKLKFKKEERSNLALINKALLYPKLFNIDDLKVQLETEEREREEAQKRWVELQKQHSKAFKRVKINASKAARSLKHGEEVYENENVVKRKLTRRSKTTAKKKSDVIKQVQSTQQALPPPTPTTEDNVTLTSPTKLPLKPKNADVPVTPANPTTTMKSNPNSNENVKYEVLQVFERPVKAEKGNYENGYANYQTTLVDNASEILTPEEQAEDTSYLNNYDSNVSNFEISDVTDEYVTAAATTKNPDMYINYVAKTEADVKTFVNLDNGAVDVFEYEDDNDEGHDYAIMDTMPATPMSTTQRELDECDIEQILMDLASGSLVLVSTLDPDNADQVINEIYMMDKVTGELCDKPLDIPEAIVQSVLSVMT